MEKKRNQWRKGRSDWERDKERKREEIKGGEKEEGQQERRKDLRKEGEKKEKKRGQNKGEGKNRGHLFYLTIVQKLRQRTLKKLKNGLKLRECAMKILHGKGKFNIVGL